MNVLFRVIFEDTPDIYIENNYSKKGGSRTLSHNEKLVFDACKGGR